MDNFIYVNDATPLIRTSDEYYPRYFFEVRSENPQIGFPYPCREDVLFDLVKHEVVNLVERPTGDVVTEGKPARNAEDNKWYQTWEIRAYTEEEYAVELARRIEQAYLNSKAVFEQDLNIGLTVTYDSVNYKFKVRPFDLSTYLSLRDTASRNPTGSFNIKAADKYLKQVPSPDYIDLIDEIIDSYYVFVNNYWGFVQEIVDATTFEDIVEIPETFIE